jgi:sigma-B regulation protein RsbU (phosphoserine phosphatase)
MPPAKRTWQEELEIIDRTMKAISGITDPEELVGVYWDNLGDLLPIEDFVSVSRRNVEPPYYLVTRSSRMTEPLNPWTQRDRLPRLTGGILGEIAYANKPVLIEDLPSRLSNDDPARFYLEGFQTLIASPHYDNGEGINVTALLIPPGVEFDFSRLPTLHWHSGLFGRGTQNLVLRNQLAAALATLDRELKTVGQIQRSLLPETLPTIPGFELAAHYQTSARAGGDYYDFFPIAPRSPDSPLIPPPSSLSYGLFIADVSGHGTPAAVLMAITHAIAHAHPGTHAPPAALLSHLNDRLARAYTRNGTFVTAFYAVLDPATRTLTYSSAGHNPPRLVRRRDNRIIPLNETATLPLGILEAQPHTQATLTLQSDDLLLLYTDGITEARGPATAAGDRELFGTERLDELLLTCNAPTAEDCIDQIRTAVAAFSNRAPPTDDQTLVAIRCL